MPHRLSHPAILLTLGAPQSLCIARSLGRRGIPVIGLDGNPRSMGVSSRYCRPVVLPALGTNPEAWLDYLVSEGKKREMPAVLFPCNDASVLWIAENRKALEPYYRFRISSLEVIRLILNKPRMTAHAKSLGLSVPRHLMLEKKEDLGRVAEEIGFPCGIKPVYSHEWKRHFATDKLISVSTASELEKEYSQLEQTGLKFFVTELIPGEDRDLFGLYTHLDRDGKPLYLYTCRKLRQYPPYFGNGSLREGIEEPAVSALGFSLLEKIGCRGLAHVEFKWDRRDESWKLIEVNPRVTIALPLLVGSGIDAPYLAYRDALDQPVEPQEAKTYRKRLLYLVEDIDAFRAYHSEGKLSWGGWLQSLWGTNVFGVFAWDDPMPFLRSVAYRMVRAGRGLLRRQGQEDIRRSRRLVFRRFIKVLLSYVLFYGGILWIHRFQRQKEGELRILVYHHITEKEDHAGLPVAVFKKQIAWIRKHYTVMALGEMLLRKKQGIPLPERAMAITFDDGYRDFVTRAYPVLKEAGLPATLFVVIDCLEHKPLWTESLKVWFDLAPLKRLDFALNGETVSLTLGNDREKREARETLKRKLKRVKNAERLVLMEKIKKELLDEKEDGVPTGMLVWEDIVKLSEGGVEIGAHTVSHPILTQLSEKEIRYEILESKKRLEARLGRSVRTFSYPNGEAEDFNEEIEQIVKETGFLGACTAIEGKNDTSSDPFTLKRLGTWERSLPVFACMLEGCFDLFQRRR